MTFTHTLTWETLQVGGRFHGHWIRCGYRCLDDEVTRAHRDRLSLRRDVRNVKIEELS